MKNRKQKLCRNCGELFAPRSGRQIHCDELSCRNMVKYICRERMTEIIKPIPHTEVKDMCYINFNPLG